MIDTTELITSLRRRGIKLFTGVPDSLLQNFSACLIQLGARKDEHIIAANEGNAVALAMGHYLATGVPALVYMQNSGLGNTVNPIASLADPEVYGIPMLLMVGWRGEPGFKDEPQHVKQGSVTEGQLQLLDIPHWVVGRDSPIEMVLELAFATMRECVGPVALLVKAGAFSNVTPPSSGAPIGWRLGEAPLLREAAIERILDALSPDDIVLVTTGKSGREMFDLRVKRGQEQRDFLAVGGMGHIASIALGVALASPLRRVVCLDGDGSMLMHLGAVAIIGDLAPRNLIHVLLNNQSHESVGGLPTVAGKVDFGAIAKACGYKGYHSARGVADIDAMFAKLAGQDGPRLCEIHLWPGSRKDLGRPSSTPQQNKLAFMAHVRNASLS